MATNPLKRQIEQDPRVQAAAAANGGYLPPEKLRELYPQAPPDWGYKGAGDGSRGWRSGPSGVVDSNDWGDKAVGAGAAAVGGLGAGLMLAPAAAAGGAAGGGGTLASSSVPTSLAMSAVPGSAGGAGMATGGGILGGIGKGLDWLGKGSDVLSSLGRVTSGAAQGSADQRLSELIMAMQQGRMATDAARDQFDAGHKTAEFERTGIDREQKRSILSSLLGGMQDTQLTPGNPRIAAAMGTRTGGARPSALTHNKEALMALLAKPDAAAPPPYQPPTLPGPSQAGTGEKVLGGIGLGTSILGALGNLRSKKVAY